MGIIMAIPLGLGLGMDWRSSGGSFDPYALQTGIKSTPDINKDDDYNNSDTTSDIILDDNPDPDPNISSSINIYTNSKTNNNNINLGFSGSSESSVTSDNNSTTPGFWSFERSNDWVAKFGNCSNKNARIAPLNIDTSSVSPCNVLCRLSINYVPTTCSVSMINNIPTVRFSPNCLAKFKNNFYYLSKMTIHYTSMHTINDSYYDLELLLYHTMNPISDNEGGIIISILLKKGNDYGIANEFLNEFINQMPANEMPIEQDIPVSDSWNPNQLMPESKSFFYYDGALPYPPCTQKWTFIVFEEIIPVSLNIIDTVKYMLGVGNKNIRPIQRKPKNISIFYNSNSQFDISQDLNNSALDNVIVKTTTPQALQQTSWLKQNIYFIKGIIISIILILMIYVAIKCAQVIVENDLLNSFIIRQLKKKQHRAAEEAKEQQAQAQAQEYGGVAPVANVDMNNNNNNNGDD